MAYNGILMLRMVYNGCIYIMAYNCILMLRMVYNNGICIYIYICMYIYIYMYIWYGSFMLMTVYNGGIEWRYIMAYNRMSMGKYVKCHGNIMKIEWNTLFIEVTARKIIKLNEWFSGKPCLTARRYETNGNWAHATISVHFWEQCRRPSLFACER